MSEKKQSGSSACLAESRGSRAPISLFLLNPIIFGEDTGIKVHAAMLGTTWIDTSSRWSTCLQEPKLIGALTPSYLRPSKVFQGGGEEF